jgi:ribonuclease T2
MKLRVCTHSEPKIRLGPSHRIAFGLPMCLALAFVIAGCKPSGPASPSGNAAHPAASSAGNAKIDAHLQAQLADASGFDYYLLNLSWSPEFCHGHPDAAECAAHSTFVLHGLWPQNNDGGYPENCASARGFSGSPDPSVFADIYPDAGLLQHEWRTHGACTGLGADTFFSAARAAFRSVTIPSAFNNLDHQASMTPDEIFSSFTAANPPIPRASLALSCGNNYLTAVEVCLDKTLHPIACGPIRSCRANVVRIPPPRYSR